MEISLDATRMLQRRVSKMSQALMGPAETERWSVRHDPPVASLLDP